MAYATYADVIARAGLAGARFGQAGAPAEGAIEEFIGDIAGIIDAAIAGQGIAVPVTDETAQRALVGVNADGALLLALSGAFPASSADQGAQKLREDVQKRYDDEMAALRAGKHVVIGMLVATGSEEAGEQAASSLWTDEPQFDLTQPFEDMNLSPSLRPSIRRGTPL